MKVPYVNIGLQHKEDKAEILSKVGDLLDSGMFILGEEVQQFEKSFAELCGTRFAVGVANGTDSLVLSMKALGVKSGDEVITVSHSYLSSASSIALCGATPVLIDVDDHFNMDHIQLEQAINERTKAIIVVHLTGRPADMEQIMGIADDRNIPVIEDAAQAVGAKYKGQVVGSFGKLGSFSLHPLKNLAAAGDAGVITTNDETLYHWLLNARNHGLRNRDKLSFWSINSRLDAVQAAILNIKMKNLERWNNRRRAIADKYIKELSSYVKVPSYNSDYEPVFHAFVIMTEQREELRSYLLTQGIDTKVHYPIPIHKQTPAQTAVKKDLNNTEKIVDSILSLPIYPELEEEQVNHVIKSIKSYFDGRRN